MYETVPAGAWGEPWPANERPPSGSRVPVSSSAPGEPDRADQGNRKNGRASKKKATILIKHTASFLMRF